ncbi:MAG: ribosome biogenesis GTPase Der [Planctomycetota bacterium]
MSKPTVAIIGRPNVGKSSLLNKLANARISIVEETPGITRDRVSTTIRVGAQIFELIDTGGIGIVDNQDLEEQIYTQIDIAIHDAQLILFMMDIRDGVTTLDLQIAQKLRNKNKSVLVVLNKCDSPHFEQDASDFYRLGFGEPVAISVTHNHQIDLLKTLILERIPKYSKENEKKAEMKIAIVGKTNTGKSTFFNKLVGSERMIVSDIPCTTRDSVDMRFQKDGKTFVAIDTAGFRKTRAVDGTFDYYSQKRSEKSIRRADVVLFFIDAVEPITKVDKQIANYIRDEHKPIVIVINKWDLAKGLPTSEYEDYLHKALRGLAFAPVVFVTAKDGKHVQSAMDVAQSIWKQAQARVSTPVINQVLGEAYKRKKPAPVKGEIGKLIYGTQIDICPPTLVLFINKLGLIPSPYVRYLENQFRKVLPYPEIPIRILFRERGQSFAQSID